MTRQLIAWDVVIAGEPRYRIDQTIAVPTPAKYRNPLKRSAFDYWGTSHDLNAAKPLRLNGLLLLARKSST